jgi:hypothetical protein
MWVSVTLGGAVLLPNLTFDAFSYVFYLSGAHMKDAIANPDQRHHPGEGQPEQQGDVYP